MDKTETLLIETENYITDQGEPLLKNTEQFHSITSNEMLGLELTPNGSLSSDPFIDTIGSELFTDSAMTGNGWTLQSTWAFVGTILRAVDCVSGENAYLSNTVVEYQRYRMSFEITDYTKGGVTLWANNQQTTFDTVGKHYVDFIADGTSEYVGVKANGETTLDIIDFSLKAITQEFSGGWRDASLESGYFTDNAGTAIWSSENKTITVNGYNGSNRGIAIARITTVSDTLYKISYTQSSPPSNAIIRINTTNVWTNSDTASVPGGTLDLGTTHYFTATTSGYTYLVFEEYDENDWTFGNVSIKEVHVDNRLYATSERFIHQSVDGTD